MEPFPVRGVGKRESEGLDNNDLGNFQVNFLESLSSLLNEYIIDFRKKKEK